MARIDINQAITTIVKKYLISFSKSISSLFYNKTDIDNKMAAIDTRSEIGSQLDYGSFGISANKTTNQNALITLNTVNQGNLTLDASGNIELKAGKKYSLKCNFAKSTSLSVTTENIVLIFYNVNTSTKIGVATNLIFGGTTATAIVDAVVDTKICLMSLSGTTSILTSAYFGVEVLEIGRTVVLDPAQQIDKESGIQDTPIGHIMSVMGVNAPTHYLICDGALYNIVDKRTLAEYFLKEFGSINYFGGDGITTFAVPDMRESVPVGTGQNTTKTIASHDTYTAGQFKDDQMQKIIGTYNGILKTDGSATGAITKVSSGTYTWTANGGSGLSGGGFTLDSSLVTRTDATNTTHGKQTGVLFCIKFEATYFMNYSPQYAGFESKVLYNGSAIVAGDYVLSDDISNYQFLYVYGDINSGSDKSMTVIDISSISTTETLSYFQYAIGYYNIRFTVSGVKLTYIDSTIGSAWSSYKPRISKIIGVKSGAAIAADFTITDAEADVAVTNIWNEVNA